MNTSIDDGDSSFSRVIARIRPPAAVAARYYANGWWRRDTVLHNLYRSAAMAKDRPVIIAHNAAQGRAITTTNGQLAHQVDRFARAFISLGINRGDPVAFQLPNRWETVALTLACMRMGAVAVPITPSMRARELGRILRDTQARICIVPDTWENWRHDQVLAEIAERLPWLRHRVVLGDAAATGAIDFEEYFIRLSHDRPGGRAVRLTFDDPDRVALAVFTSGTSGEIKGVLHSHNTFYAATGAHVGEVERGWRPGEVFSAPFAICDMVAMLYCVWGPLLAGGTGVIQDRFNPEVLLDLAETAKVNQITAAPPHWGQLIAIQRQDPRKLPALRSVMHTGSPMPTHLVEELRQAFGVPVRSAWGMTEVGMGIRSRDDDPPEASTHSDGWPLTGLETRLAGVGEADTGVYQLSVRGPSRCLGTWGADSTKISATWEDDDGWLDTGDMVSHAPNGLRIVGRAADRIGNVVMIPVAEVEAELARHPSVQEVAIVSYSDPRGRDLPCAFVVPTGVPPTLAELRQYLSWRGMTASYQPSRLELVAGLPRNHNGKVRKDRLRQWLAGGRT
jgi:cyclohexanecarboxylate-CoA ligase